MPDGFTPRFVDLVRNYSMTVGTGDFVLGTAVNGYTSLGSALQTGDRFYYSAIGIDKPGEREVGRGTLLADGTIAREPISGPKTNFTTGTKTVALVASAEWFNEVQASAGSGAATIVASRSELAAAPTSAPAILVEGARSGTFVFDPANLSAYVTADTQQGIYVAPVTGPSGASGAWVRQFDGTANVRWWGAIAGPNDNSAAFLSAIATLKERRLRNYGYGAGASCALYVPASRAGAYQLGSTTLRLSHALRLFGDATGQPGGGGSVLSWGAEVTGISCEAGSDGAIIERLMLLGGFNDTESEAHGIAWDSPITIRDVSILSFPGDGLYQANDSGGGSGNSNGTLIDRVFVNDCRNAFYNAGGDVSAQEIRGIRAIANRQAGIYERGFLGNGHYSHEVASNARLAWNTGAANRPCSFVTQGGNRYACVVGQEAWCSTHAPTGAPTNNQGWLFWGAGGVDTGIPAWFNGINVRPGGGYIQHGQSNRREFHSCYAEDDQFNQFDQFGLVFGGLMSATALVIEGVGATGGEAKRIMGTSGNNGISFPGGMNSGGLNSWIASVRAFVLGALLPSGGVRESGSALVRVENTGGSLPDGTTGLGLELAGNNGGFGYSLIRAKDRTANIHGPLYLDGSEVRFQGLGADVATLTNVALNLAADVALQLNGTTVINAARAANVTALTVNGVTLSAAGLALMDDADAAAQRATLGLSSVASSGSAADLSTGTLTRPVATSGDVTTTGGKIGYDTGAGGTAVQATNKGTGVTLNKVCGQITMNGAALAANTAVTFTLTNSQIAPGDRIVLNHVSGGTFGAYLLDGRSSAESATIVVRNVTAGSLSEAIVLGFAVQKAVIA